MRENLNHAELELNLLALIAGIMRFIMLFIDHLLNFQHVTLNLVTELALVGLPPLTTMKLAIIVICYTIFELGF